MSIGKPKSEGAPLLPTTSSDPVVDKVDAEPAHHALLGITCVALASLCFSFMVTFIKYMTYSISSMEATFWRSVGVLAFNYITVKLSGTSLYVPLEHRWMLLYRCLVGFACMGFAFYAMSQMVLADASALILTSPVMTFFMSALFLGEKIDPVSLLCAFGSFGGLICVVRPGFLFGYDESDASKAGSWIGVCSALLGALSQVGVFLTVRQLKGLNVFVIVHYFALASVILTLLWLTLIQQTFVIPTTFLLWRAIIGTGVFAFCGQMLLTRGFQLEKAGVAAVMRYLQVVFVFIWDSIILGEHIDHWSIVGAFIIVSGAVAGMMLDSSDKKTPLLPRVDPPIEFDVVHRDHSLLGLASVAVSALCFSIMTTLIKYQTYSMTSMEAIFWRSTGAFVFNFMSVLSLRKSLYVAPEKRTMLALRCLAGFSSIAFAFYAISQMVLADASCITFSSPIFTFFAGACLLHERIDPVSLLSAIVAFSGLVFVVRPGFIFGYDHPSDGASWDAIGAAFLGALGQVFVFITVRKLQGVHALVIVHYFMLSSAITALGWVFIVQKAFFIPSAFEEWRAIVGCGLFTFLGQMFLTKGFQLEKAGVASVMRYLDVVFVFIWDSAILKERIDPWSIVGAVIIISSAVVIAVRKVKESDRL